MKVLFSLFLSIISLSSIAKDATLISYQKFLDQFYYIDMQDFKKVTCDFSSPVWLDQIKYLKEQFNAKEFKLSETYSKLKLYYSKSSGLSFSEADFDLNYKGNTEGVDLQQLQSGIEQIKQGLQMTLQGAIQSISGVFDELKSKRDEEIEIESIELGKEDRLKMKMGGFIFEINKKDKVLDFTMKSDQVDFAGKNTYVDQDKKLLFKTTELKGNQGPMKLNVTSTVEYQKLKKMQFPKSVVSKTNVNVSGTEQTVDLKLDLSNCIVE